MVRESSLDRKLAASMQRWRTSKDFHFKIQISNTLMTNEMIPFSPARSVLSGHRQMGGCETRQG